jgi:hypothetical protein
MEPLGPQFRNARIRAFLAKYAVIIGGAGVFVGMIFVLTIRSCMADPVFTLPPSSTNAYFYDIQDSALVEMPDNLIPPIKRGSHELALAVVFACKNCADPADRFTGYLKTFTPERKKAEETMRAGLAAGEELPLSEINRLSAQGGLLIRAPLGIKFIPWDDPDAQAIINEAAAKCPESIVECKPR